MTQTIFQVLRFPPDHVSAVTFWNEDLEGNRVGEPVRVEVTPDLTRLFVPKAMDEEAWEFHYRTCFRIDTEPE